MLVAHLSRVDKELDNFDQNLRIEAQISREMEKIRDANKAEEYRRNNGNGTLLRVMERWFKY
jgi:hypothetical protein